MFSVCLFVFIVLWGEGVFFNTVAALEWILLLLVIHNNWVKFYFYESLMFFLEYKIFLCVQKMFWLYHKPVNPILGYDKGRKLTSLSMLEIYGWTAIKNSVNSNLANQIQPVIQRWMRTIFKKMIHSPNLKTNWRAHLQHGSYQIWEFFPDFRIIWSREKLRRIIW